MQTDRHDRHVDRHTDTQTDTQTDRQTRQINRKTTAVQTDRHDRRTDRQTDQTDRQEYMDRDIQNGQLYIDTSDVTLISKLIICFRNVSDQEMKPKHIETTSMTIMNTYTYKMTIINLLCLRIGCGYGKGM